MRRCVFEHGSEVRQSSMSQRGLAGASSWESREARWMQRRRAQLGLGECSIGEWWCSGMHGSRASPCCAVQGVEIRPGKAGECGWALFSAPRRDWRVARPGAALPWGWSTSFHRVYVQVWDDWHGCVSRVSDEDVPCCEWFGARCRWR